MPDGQPNRLAYFKIMNALQRAGEQNNADHTIAGGKMAESAYPDTAAGFPAHQLRGFTG
jgi:hypothetical protein